MTTEHYLSTDYNTLHTTLCLKQTTLTDVAHYNFDADHPILIFLAEMLLREYAIKQ